MGVSLSYTTTNAVAPEVRKAIRAEARRLNQQRPWWGEGLLFFTDPKRRGHLTGDTKLFRHLGGDDDDQFMAFHDGRFILRTLAGWSRAHGLSWVVEMQGAEIARIARGRIAPPGLFEANASPAQLQADDERARRIHAEEDDEEEPAERKVTPRGTGRGAEQPGKAETPRQLQARWTEELLARAKAVLTKAPPDLEALRSIFGEVTVDGQSYIDCRGFTLAHEAILNLQATHLDFSHSRLEYPLAYARLTNCRFVGVKYAETVFSGEYIGCDFTSANLRRSRTSTPFRMADCDFTRANCSGSEWDLANFHDCRFVETNIKRVEWTLCKFTKCTFMNLVLGDAYIAGCSFIEPSHNMRWFDEDRKAEMTHVVRADAPWMDWHGANVSDVRIQ